MQPPQGNYHLVGIAGVGMSALAQALLNAGHDVSGSDRFCDQGRGDLDVLAVLRRAGVQLLPQDGSGATAGLTGVVVSSAIEADNPDLLAAQQRGVPVLHRAELLARLAAGRRLIAVTGTAGKTTVTGLLGYLLEGLGADPTVINGGNVLNWQRANATGSVRCGGTDLWVLEADESDQSLLRFAPDWAIVTNISKDHFELPEVVALFRRFAAQVKTGIICGPGVAELIRGYTSAVLITPSDVEATVSSPDVEATARRLIAEKRPAAASTKAVQLPPDMLSPAAAAYASPLPGRHNAENVLLAATLCEQLGFAPVKIRAALAGFQGLQRRLEKVGEAHGVLVYDDYAHNPVKIAAAWRAVAPTQGRVFGIWRPHGYGPLKLMLQELADAFAAVCRPGDRVFLLPVFYAGGTASPTVTTAQLADELRARGVSAEAIPDDDQWPERLCADLRPSDVVLCMGARDPDLPKLARRLAAGLQESKST